MSRSVIFVGLLAALVLTVGCGKPAAMVEAPPSKPRDLGPPGNWRMGVTMDQGGFYVVKNEVGGEVRMYVMIRQVPSVPGQLQYDADAKIFHNRDRSRRYDINGFALHTEPDPPPRPNAVPFSMRRKKVALDRATGNVLVHVSGDDIPEAQWEDPRSGAYVVVP